MSTAREIMHAGASCVQESETLEAAARRMRELDVGALPICGADDRLHGIVTDRDRIITMGDIERTARRRHVAAPEAQNGRTPAAARPRTAGRLVEVAPAGGRTSAVPSSPPAG